MTSHTLQLNLKVLAVAANKWLSGRVDIAICLLSLTEMTGVDLQQEVDSRARRCRAVCPGGLGPPRTSLNLLRLTGRADGDLQDSWCDGPHRVR